MPFLDQRTGALVVRVVYDGAAEAGKTTNLRRLEEGLRLTRRGARVEAPGSAGRRTQFFDWLDFQGGEVGGRPVRCQLVSVPGQPELLRRRTYLLDAADAVVFVADARPHAVGRTRRSWHQLRSLLARRSAGTVPIGLVVQANKRDLAGALGPVSLASFLEVPTAVPILSASAERGEGVRGTFLAAVRLAIERVRALLETGSIEGFPAVETSAEALLDAMRQAEGAGLAVKVQRRAEGARERAARERDEGRSGPSLPSSEALPAGFSWPPVLARSLLEGAGALERAPRVRPWAPAGAEEWRTERGLVVHTRRAWRFEAQAAARDALLREVRALVRVRELLPDERALVLGPDGEGWRLWAFAPASRTLEEELERAVRSGSDLGAWLGRIRRADAWLAGREVDLPLTLDAVALVEDTPRCLGWPGEGEDAASLEEQARRWLDERGRVDGALRARVAAALR